MDTNAILFWFSLLLHFHGSLGLAQYQGLIPNGDKVPCPPDQPECSSLRVCNGIGHQDCRGGAINKANNAFGKDFATAGHSWTKELCQKDSDMDGFTNGEELGDPCCTWTKGTVLTTAEGSISHPGVASSKPANKSLVTCSSKSSSSSKNKTEQVQMFLDSEPKLNVTKKWTYNVTLDYTVYVDVKFNLPTDKTYYLTGYKANIDKAEFMHHYVVNACKKEIAKEKEGKILPPDLTRTVDNCTSTIFTWAPGQGPYAYPPNASFAFGKGTDIKSLSIELHYTNSNKKKGFVDQSSLVLYYTTKPRQYQSGIKWTGTDITVGRIPPKTKQYFSANLEPMQLQGDSKKSGIKVFGAFLHAHLLGRRIWVEQFRKDSSGKFQKVRDIYRDDAWNFDLQSVLPIDTLVIEDGDAVATTCIYDSSNSTDYTFGGLGTNSEMCLAFLSYYPLEGVAEEQRSRTSYDRVTGVLPENATSYLDLLSAQDNYDWKAQIQQKKLICSPEQQADLQKKLKGSQNVTEQIGTICGKEAQLRTTGPGIQDQLGFNCSDSCAKDLYQLISCNYLSQEPELQGSSMFMSQFLGQSCDVVMNQLVGGSSVPASQVTVSQTPGTSGTPSSSPQPSTPRSGTVDRVYGLAALVATITVGWMLVAQI